MVGLNNFFCFYSDFKIFFVFLVFYGGFVVDIVVVLLCVYFGGGILINDRDLRQNFSNIIGSIKKNIY